MTYRARFFFVLIAGYLGPGCGLALDYDPPTDGGLDAPQGDGGVLPECRTELDCDDGAPCNGLERCVEGACEDGPPIECRDDDVCDGVSACNPATGECVPGPGIACANDDNPCNGEEICDPVVGCTTVPFESCDDGIACTIDSCDPAMGCMHVGDNTACTEGMSGGLCMPDGCHYPSCDGVVCADSPDPCVSAVACSGGRCIETRLVCPTGQECCGGSCGPIDCDDREDCTRDTCNRASGCENVPALRSCDDGDRCTVGDRCVGGSCVPGGDPCGPLDQCTDSDCNAATGMCDRVPLDGRSCIDGDPCVGGDTCVGGACVSGTTVDLCEDFNPCTSDSCDASMGGCFSLPVADGTNCGTVLTPRVCRDGVCVARTLCPLGRLDCDLDGSCECLTLCVGGLGLQVCAPTGDCRVSGCGLGEVCCERPGSPSAGTCHSVACLSCCMAVAD